MTTNDKSAPERIAIRWEPGQAVTNGLLMEHPDYTQYVRADLASAPVSLGKRVLEQRMANGLSLRELSEKTGVSYSVIARIERGECVQPTPRVSAALEDWLAAVPDSRLAKVEAAARLGLQMAEANDLWNTAETIRDALQPSETAAQATPGVVEVCPECDIAGCRHIRAKETVAQTRDAALAKAVAIMDDERNQRGATKACDGLWTARTRVAALRTIPPEDPVAEAARVDKETLACCRLAARLADEGCSAFDVAVAIAARRKPAGGP